ncbi:hypothetical protein CCH79_00019830 [Gambusia affinis]|uniref:Potassium channel tetramerisation-type BTB domain-containing protein n=1 Tax=Gambusia affinis TaxID=33528 RepID=A0A315VZ92_GAMAF|nr:hypothetical protein CCH79_00019830 [Gambusia affinis]
MTSSCVCPLIGCRKARGGTSGHDCSESSKPIKIQSCDLLLLNTRGRQLLTDRALKKQHELSEGAPSSCRPGQMPMLLKSETPAVTLSLSLPLRLSPPSICSCQIQMFPRHQSPYSKRFRSCCLTQMSPVSCSPAAVSSSMAGLEAFADAASLLSLNSSVFFSETPAPSASYPLGAVVVNVGGTRYVLSQELLASHPETRLGKLVHCGRDSALELCDDADFLQNEFFFDRSSQTFQ